MAGRDQSRYDDLMWRRLASLVASLVVLVVIIALAVWYWSDDPPSVKSNPESSSEGQTQLGSKPTVKSVGVPPRFIFVEVLAKEQPIIGAKVRLTFGHGAVKELTTDVEGIAALEVRGGVSRAQISASGYQNLDQIPHLPGEGDVSWTVELHAAVDAETAVSSRFRGIVLCGGVPFAGAAVALLSEVKTGRALGVVSTDPRGRFVLETEVPLAEIEQIGISAAGCGTAYAAPSTDREIVVDLAGSGEIQVRVVDGEGVAIEGAKVRASQKGLPPFLFRKRGRKLNPILNATRAELVGEADGQPWTLKPASAGGYQVLAEAPGWSPKGAQAQVLVGERTELTITLMGVVVVEGQVTDIRTSAPIVGVRVSARVSHARRGGFGVARTDAQGRYRLETQPGQRHTLSFKRRGYLMTQESGVMGEPGDRIERDAQMRPASASEAKSRSYVGIGAVLKKIEDGVRIERVMPGGSAAESLLKGDLITEVDGEDVRDLPLREVVERILGEEGEPVEVVLERQGETHTLELQRTRLQVKR